jgi:hypothetical protein
MKKKGNMIEVLCGMCNETVEVPNEQLLEIANMGVLCQPCQDYTNGYLHPNEGGT